MHAHVESRPPAATTGTTRWARLGLSLTMLGLIPIGAHAQPYFVGLGDLPGGAFWSEAEAVSSDGLVAVGQGTPASGSSAFRWSSASGMLALPGGSRAYATSADGFVVVGSGSAGLAFYWTAAGGTTYLGDLPGGSVSSWAWDVSDDGLTVVGVSASALAEQEAFRWTPATGMVGLGDLPGGTVSSAAYGVSGDGQWVVGRSGSPYEAFAWSAATGMSSLGDLPGGTFYSVAEAASYDGSVIVGYSSSAVSNTVEPFRWTAATGMVGLGLLEPGHYPVYAKDVTPAGDAIVGWGRASNKTIAAVWTAPTGWISVASFLTSRGVSIPGGWSLETCRGVTVGGGYITIVGDGIKSKNRQAWLARAVWP